MFCGYQINLGSTSNPNSSLSRGKEGEGERGDIQYFWEGGRTLYGETWHFIGGLDDHLEAILYYITLISL